MGTLANSEDPDEMQHNADFIRVVTEVNHNLENSTRDPLKYTIGSPILIVSTCMEKSIRIQRVKVKQPALFLRERTAKLERTQELHHKTRTKCTTTNLQQQSCNIYSEKQLKDIKILLAI